jgi:hypothetical protein
MFLRLRLHEDMSDYVKRMKDLDYFLERLAEGRACAEGPRGFKHYDVLYRAVCGGGEAGVPIADLGPEGGGPGL